MKKNQKKNKKSLGRGLSALLQGSDDLEESENPQDKLPENDDSGNEKFQLININAISSNPNQPRSIFNQEKLNELSQSIKTVGIIEPILLRKDPTNQQKYEIIAGERRWRAAKIAGFDKIPAIIRTQSNDDLMEIMLIENLQREDLTPLEEAQGYEDIINKKKITQEQLGETLGKSRAHITNMIRILKAPLKVKQLLVENKLSMSQVRTILSLDEIEMKDLAIEAVEKRLSVRELENRVNKINENEKKNQSNQPIKPNPEQLKDTNILEIENHYRDKLKTKVSISMIKKKVGKIEIEYYHYDELLEILNRIQDNGAT